jgi:DNA invertase Pin-like site-specific DNA recombinase
MSIEQPLTLERLTMSHLRAAGVSLKATEQRIDTSTAAGKAFLDMLGVFPEFETNLRRVRQMEGIAQAKAKGVIEGASRRSIRSRCGGCGSRRSWGPRRSPSVSESAALRSRMLSAADG